MVAGHAVLAVAVVHVAPAGVAPAFAVVLEDVANAFVDAFAAVMAARQAEALTALGYSVKH